MPTVLKIVLNLLNCRSKLYDSYDLSFLNNNKIIKVRYFIKLKLSFKKRIKKVVT